MALPQRLSTEQCSSELTARYKSSLASGNTLTDLTGGMGIDTLFLSEGFVKVHYVERDEELCRLAKHNFQQYNANKNIEIHCVNASDYLATMLWSDTIYIDPARRATSGKKVYRLEECEPNVIDLLPALRTRCSNLLLKLSPMLDITAALQYLTQAKNVYIISVKNEVKEVLIHCGFAEDGAEISTPVFHAIALNKDSTSFDFSFSQEDENNAFCQYATEILTYLFEPDAAIMKAGAFKLVAQHYELQKLAVNSHLYISDTIPARFFGRVWRVVGIADKRTIRGMQLNVLSRNYPLSADDIRKKYHILEGGSQWLIATRLHERPLLLLAERCD